MTKRRWKIWYAVVILLAAPFAYFLFFTDMGQRAADNIAMMTFAIGVLGYMRGTNGRLTRIEKHLGLDLKNPDKVE